MDSNTLCALDFHQAKLSLGYDLGKNGEVALQQIVDVNDKNLGNLSIAYYKRVNNDLELKAKVDKNFMLNLFTRYRLYNSLHLGATLETKLYRPEELHGFLNQPLNFGLRFTYDG